MVYLSVFTFTNEAMDFDFLMNVKRAMNIRNLNEGIAQKRGELLFYGRYRDGTIGLKKKKYEQYVLMYYLYG